MTHNTAIHVSVDIRRFRKEQSEFVLRPYDHFLEADRWPLATQTQVDTTIREGWVWKSFDLVSLQPPVAWDEVCSHRSHEFALHAWHFIGPILDIYDREREFKYLDFAIQLALDWISQYPSTETPSAFAWYDVAIGARAARLAYIIDASTRESEVPDHTIAQLLSGAMMHAQVLTDDTRFNPQSNHGFYFAAGQLAQAHRLALLPGMNESAHQARKRVLSIMRTQFTDEGGHREHSPHYHFLVLWTFSRLLASGLLNGEEFDRLSNQVQEALVWFVLPNRHLVNFGDSDSIPMTKNERLHMLNESLRFVITGGREGSPLDEPMRAFPATGYVVMRNGWPSGPENFANWSYLAQICAFHSNVHKHFDELSFVWYDRGHQWLIDGGKYGYLYNDPNRIYVESTQAHNTVTVDGRSWARRGSRRPYGSALRRWGEADGTYFTETEVRHWNTIQHTRVLLFRPGEWLIVFDWLSDDAGKPHEFTQRFLFAPELNAEAAGSALSLTLPDGAITLYMAPLLASETLPLVKGQRDPEMLGWVSLKAGTMTPCWSGGYMATNRSQHAFATLFAFGEDPPQTTELVSSCDDSGRQVHLQWRQDGMEQAVAFSRPKTGPFTLNHRVGNGGNWEWPDQPDQPEEDKVTAMKYDLALFEQLNEEYRERPIVDVSKTRKRRQLLSPQLLPPAEAQQETVTRAERAQYAATNQLKPILKDIDLTGKAVLELGCGHGWLTAILPDQAGVSKAIGVDVERYSSWPEHTDPRVELIEADLSREQVVAQGSIDTVISNVTFEHVSQPLQMLSALYEVLKDGGEAWLRMNVHTSRTASHKYSEVFFPWPHLLFEDEICEQFYLKHHGKAGQRFSWINRMTVAHYLQAVREIGFDVTRVGRSFAPIDVPFYLRFVDKLGRYAAMDLETDFLTLVLRKSPGGDADETRTPVDFEYHDRQRELDGRIMQLIGGDEAASKGQQLATRLHTETAASATTDPSPAPVLATAVSVQPASAETHSEPEAGNNINTRTYWDRVYRREWESGQVFSATYARDYGPVHEAIMTRIPQDARVLDVACGSGVLCQKIKERFPTSLVTGVDFSQYTIGRIQWVDRDSGNEYICLDVQTSLPSLSRTFDVVIMAEIIEHLDDPNRTIADAVNLLNPGGHLIITCPHDDAIPSKEHVREWGHNELFHALAPYNDTVCFTQFLPPHDKWMMAHLIKPV